jgi:hypothetical protein
MRASSVTKALEDDAEAPLRSARDERAWKVGEGEGRLSTSPSTSSSSFLLSPLALLASVEGFLILAAASAGPAWADETVETVLYNAEKVSKGTEARGRHLPVHILLSYFPLLPYLSSHLRDSVLCSNPLL